jgi:hypothetical protein
MRLVHDMIKVTLGKQAPVLSCIGNHDAYPIDQFDTPPGSSWYLNEFAEEMSYWLPADIISQLKYAGYYTVSRMIIFNDLFSILFVLDFVLSS